MYLERINIMCALAGISQSKLASELGISKQHLNSMITGKYQINNLVRIGILRHFGLPEKIFTQHVIHLTIKGNKLIVL